MPQTRYFIALDTLGTPRRMRSRLFLPALFALAAVFAAPQALGWGDRAHRIVARLAQAQLRPAAAAEATRLLAGESDPSLPGISNWADTVREDGGKAGRRTRRWHYGDFLGASSPDGRPGCDYQPARDCPDGDCVVAAIDREFVVLSDRRRPNAERTEALKYLVHLVADVHQPLHSSPVADKGGLDFQVNWQGKGDNLHLLWDFGLLDRALERDGLDEAGYVRTLQALPALPSDPTRDSDRRVAEWAEESCRVVRDGALYPATHVLGDEYLDAHRAQMEERLRLAGSRLADLLNRALDPGTPR
jgi:hypothetical protein